MSPGEAVPTSGANGDHPPDASRSSAPIAVVWSESRRLPVAFVWRRRRYRIERVLETWILETGWWKEEGFINRAFWRVRAEGRVFDLRYDRITKSWALERILS